MLAGIGASQLLPNSYRLAPLLIAAVVYLLYMMLNPRERERSQQAEAQKRQRAKEKLLAEKLPVLSRTYLGTTAASVNRKFEQDAALLAEAGYQISRQQWLEAERLQVTYELVARRGDDRQPAS